MLTVDETRRKFLYSLIEASGYSAPYQGNGNCQTDIIAFLGETLFSFIEECRDIRHMQHIIRYMADEVYDFDCNPIDKTSFVRNIMQVTMDNLATHP